MSDAQSLAQSIIADIFQRVSDIVIESDVEGNFSVCVHCSSTHENFNRFASNTFPFKLYDIL